MQSQITIYKIIKSLSFEHCYFQFLLLLAGCLASNHCPLGYLFVLSFNSTEPLGSQGELTVQASSGVRPSTVFKEHLLQNFLSHSK